MEIIRKPFAALSLFVLVSVTPCVVFSGSADSEAQQNGKIDIVIKHSTFIVQGAGLKPDRPATIVLHNEDPILHGFTSPLLAELELRVEGQGVVTYGKGIKGLYIKPGSTVTLHFVPTRPGRYPFRCDIHPKMKGELLLLSIGNV